MAALFSETQRCTHMQKPFPVHLFDASLSEVLVASFGRPERQCPAYHLNTDVGVGSLEFKGQFGFAVMIRKMSDFPYLITIVIASWNFWYMFL